MSINLTEVAANEVLKVMKEQDLKPEDNCLRVGVIGGGCSGFQYTLTFEGKEKVDDQDELMEVNGVNVVVDMKSDLYLNGTTLDFYQDINRRGFVFSNPNSTGCCGCGSSFQI